MTATPNTGPEREKSQAPRMTVAEAGLTLGRSYNQVMRLLLRGDLKGGKQEGHWFVERASVRKMAKQAAA